jgi:RNAse (barnase) inhibitor barstar
MSGYLDALIDGDRPPGRYRLRDPAPVRALRDELSAAEWTMRIVDGAVMIDRATMFEEFAAACDFPDWFGANWDAFADCLKDLSWLPDRPTVVCWQRSGAFADRQPKVFATAGQVIDAAIADRVAAGLAPLYLIYPAPPQVTAERGPMLRPVD